MLFIKAYRGEVLHQAPVIATEGHHKQHGLNTVKAAQPLSLLAPLAPYIIHPVNKKHQAH